MALKFRRRQKLFPGVYLNFSTKGVSTTIGVKGFNVNLGQKGAYLNTGIPGTGLYDRKKIANWSNNQSAFPSQENNYIPNSEQNLDPYFYFPKSIEGEIKSNDANTVTSEGLSEIKETFLAAFQEKKDIQDEIPLVEADIRKAANLKLLSQILIFGLFTDKFKNKYSEKVDYLQNLKQQYENCKVQIDIDIEPNIKVKYQQLRQAFDELSRAHKIWDMTSSNKNTENKSAASTTIRREITNIALKRIEFINAEFDALYFKNQNGSDIYIYPAFAVVFDDHNNFGLVSLNDLSITFRSSRFLEEEEIPRDTKVVGDTWAKVNKDGSPDRRFTGNYKIPIVEYGEIEFKSSAGINEVFMISNHNVAKQFVSIYNSYINPRQSNKVDSTVLASKNSSSENITYISNRQAALVGSKSENIEFNQARRIFVYGDSFRVELPDDTILSGTLIPKKKYKESEEKYFETDQECPIVIKPKEIFINLYKTHDAAFTFYLD